jgi:UDP-N-acetylmuramate dehydrogenase
MDSSLKQQFLEALEKIVGKENISIDEPMSRHTTFGVGGTADVLVRPDVRCLPEIIRLCEQHQEPYYVIGNGSNLLVGDKGIRGIVLETLCREDNIRVDDTCITAGVGMLLSRVASKAAEHGLTGMEFAAGIPGTLGGAVVMNAGAYGGEMKDILCRVTVVDAQGTIHNLSVEELELGYRTSCIASRGYIVTEVELQLAKGERTAIVDRMKELSRMRVEKQPLEYPSAGSTFKRPEGYFAGKLIMDAGLRGYQVGGAQVSEKHCGFVINRGNATASDICRLMQEVSERVQEQFGVTLEPEVKMIGEFK